MAYYDNESTPFASILQTSPTQVISLPLPLQIQPGTHTFIFEIAAPYFVTSILKENVTVWMNTSIIVIIDFNFWDSNQSPIYQQIEESTHCNWLIVDSNSCGSIIRPPPILFNGITSTVSRTTRETSLNICPRFNSGTSILSTVLLKSRIA